MRPAFALIFLLGLFSTAFVSPAQEVMPAGITCCDEGKIRAAMTEEALARIVAISEGKDRLFPDYLSAQAFGKVRHLLPAGAARQRLEFLRDLLQRPAADAQIGEFQVLVGNFVLGMTLEIGHTFQDEYDRALTCCEQADRLASELEKRPVRDDESLSRVMFHAGVSDRELRRLQALERKWKEPLPGAAPFDEFNLLKKNAIGHGADPDQRMVFGLAASYRASYPFLDEFLGAYRRLAGEIRAVARRVGELTADNPG